MPSGKLPLSPEDRKQTITVSSVPSEVQRGALIKVVMFGRVTGITDTEGYSSIQVEASDVEFESATIGDEQRRTRTSPLTETIYPDSMLSGAGPSI